MIRAFKHGALGALMAMLIPMAVLAQTTFISGTIALPNTSLPLANGTLTLSLSDAFGKPTSAIIAGSFAIAGKTLTCATDSNGNVVSINNPLVPAIATAQAAAGSLSGTYYVAIDYYDSLGHRTLPSTPVAVLVSGPNNSILVQPPIVQPATANGYEIFLGTTPSNITLQLTVGGFVNETLNTLLSGTTPPVTNATVCALYFNDVLIPYGTTYKTNLLDSNGTQVAGFPQSWYLSGSSVSVSIQYPIAPSALQTRFPNPILQNPSNNSQQSVASPVTTNGYPLTSGALILPNNSNPPATTVGETIIYTNNLGATQICQNGAACAPISGGITFPLINKGVLFASSTTSVDTNANLTWDNSIKQLAVTGASATFAELINGTGTAGNNFGVEITAGGNTTDYPLFIRNLSSTFLAGINGRGDFLLGNTNSAIAPLFVTGSATGPQVQMYSTHTNTVLEVTSNGSTGNQGGIDIFAGTNASDLGFRVNPNSTFMGMSHSAFEVRGDYNVMIWSLTATGAATGKKVVCVDTSTGVLYASSASNSCLN